ncbi:unnamed protein product [Closterium sp. NIES-54]
MKNGITLLGEPGKFTLKYGDKKLGTAVEQNGVFVLNFIPERTTADADNILSLDPWEHRDDIDYTDDTVPREGVVPTSSTTAAAVMLTFDGQGLNDVENSREYMAAVTGWGTLSNMPTADGTWGADEPDETTWGETPAERDARLLAEAEQRVAEMEVLDSGRLVGVEPIPTASDQESGELVLAPGEYVDVEYRPSTAPLGKFDQRAKWGLHLGIEKQYSVWRIMDYRSRLLVPARDCIFYENLTLPVFEQHLTSQQNPATLFPGVRSFANADVELAASEEPDSDGAREAAPDPPVPVTSSGIPEFIPLADAAPEDVREMYRLDDKGSYALLVAYVDDILYVSSSTSLGDRIEAELKKSLDLTISTKVTQFLGLNVSRTPSAICLTASKYAESLAKRFNISTDFVATPYRSTLTGHVPNLKNLSTAGLQLYQQQLGCLLFAAVTCRPDLAYVASHLAQFLRCPKGDTLSTYSVRYAILSLHQRSD